MRGNRSNASARRAAGVAGVALAVVGALADDSARSPEREFREALIETAETSLRAGLRREFSTEHFHVVSDAGDEAWAASVPGALESVYSALDAVWPEEPGGGERAPVRVYLFAERSRFLRFCMRAPIWTDCLRSRGFHDPRSDLLVFTVEVEEDQRSLVTLLHEAAHAFLHARFSRQESETDKIPPWLHEGIAGYVALSQMRDGAIELGSFCRKARHTSAGPSARGPSRAELEVRELRAGLADGTVRLDVRSLVSVDEREKHRLGQPGAFYIRSWLLVDYLSREVDGLGSDRFTRLVKEIASGASFEDAAAKIYRKSLVAIEREFGGHVASFRARRCR